MSKRCNQKVYGRACGRRAWWEYVSWGSGKLQRVCEDHRWVMLSEPITAGYTKVKEI